MMLSAGCYPTGFDVAGADREYLEQGGSLLRLVMARDVLHNEATATAYRRFFATPPLDELMRTL